MTDLRSIEAVLDKLDNSEFMLMNLFEVKRGMWQCNLRRRLAGTRDNSRDDPWYHEWSLGKTALEALTAAWSKVEAVANEEYDF